MPSIPARVRLSAAAAAAGLSLALLVPQPAAAADLVTTCIQQVGNAYFQVTKVNGVTTLTVAITSGVAGMFLALGVPRCE